MEPHPATLATCRPHRWALALCGLALSGLALCAGCGGVEDAIQVGGNTTLTFYRHTVDETGAPLAGVSLRFEIESFPAGRILRNRDGDLPRTPVTVRSGPDGRFSFPATGFRLWRTDVRVPQGFRHFDEVDVSAHPSTRAITFNSNNRQIYRSDPSRPAIFVFVRDGATKTDALPTIGGESLYEGRHWRPNDPTWPRKSSLHGLTHGEQSSTAPS